MSSMFSLPMQLAFEPLPNAPGHGRRDVRTHRAGGTLGTEGISPGADIIVNERTSGEMLNVPMEVPQLAASTKIKRASGRS